MRRAAGTRQAIARLRGRPSHAGARPTLVTDQLVRAMVSMQTAGPPHLSRERSARRMAGGAARWPRSVAGGGEVGLRERRQPAEDKAAAARAEQAAEAAGRLDEQLRQLEAQRGATSP